MEHVLKNQANIKNKLVFSRLPIVRNLKVSASAIVRGIQYSALDLKTLFF